MSNSQKKFLSVLTLIVISIGLGSADATAFCFEQAGAEYNISPLLLYTIAKVESNFNPRAISWNKNGTYDFGVMQINSAWRKVIGEDAWMSLGDPCYNVKIGAWVLAGCIKKFGYTWEAVGCYNAASKEKRVRYAYLIAKSVNSSQKSSAVKGEK